MNWRKLFKIGLYLFLFGLLCATGVYLYVFHKPHRNVAKEKAAYTLTADKLFSEFNENETASYQKYGDQVIEVKGNIAGIEISKNSASIMLLDQMSGINCGFDSIRVAEQKETFNHLHEGQTITIKGKCDGFDMIMGVVLTRCVFVQEEN